MGSDAEFRVQPASELDWDKIIDRSVGNSPVFALGHGLLHGIGEGSKIASKPLGQMIGRGVTKAAEAGTSLVENTWEGISEEYRGQGLAGTNYRATEQRAADPGMVPGEPAPRTLVLLAARARLELRTRRELAL